MTELVDAFKVLAPYVGVLSVLGAIVSYLIKQWMDGQKKIKEMEAKEALSAIDNLRGELKDHKISLDTLSGNMLKAYQKIGESNVRLERVSVSSDLLVKEMAEAQKSSLTRLRAIEDTLDHAELIALGPKTFMIKPKK